MTGEPVNLERLESDISADESFFAGVKLDLLKRINAAIDLVSKSPDYSHDEKVIALETLARLTKRVDKL